MMNTIAIIYPVMLFLSGIILTVLFLTARNKIRIARFAYVLLGIDLVAIFLMIYLPERSWSPASDLFRVLGWGAILFVALYDAFLLRFEDEEDDWFYRLSGPIVGICFLAWLLFQVITGKYYEPLFLGALAVIGFLHYFTRRHPEVTWLFQASAVFVTLMLIMLFILHPLLNGAHLTDYPRVVFLSIAFNAQFAVFPFAFFMGNMRYRKLIKNIEMVKVFKLVYILAFGAALYRNPLAREFVNRLPVFKELLPGSSGAVAFMFPPVFALLRMRSPKRQRRPNKANSADAKNRAAD